MLNPVVSDIHPHLALDQHLPVRVLTAQHHANPGPGGDAGDALLQRDLHLFKEVAQRVGIGRDDHLQSHHLGGQFRSYFQAPLQTLQVQQHYLRDPVLHINGFHGRKRADVVQVEGLDPEHSIDSVRHPAHQGPRTAAHQVHVPLDRLGHIRGTHLEAKLDQAVFGNPRIPAGQGGDQLDTFVLPLALGARVQRIVPL